MPSTKAALLLALCLGARVGADLVRTLRTGRVHGKDGIMTRGGQPRRFWRYVYGDYAVLALCAVILLWLMIPPESFS